MWILRYGLPYLLARRVSGLFEDRLCGPAAPEAPGWCRACGPRGGLCWCSLKLNKSIILPMLRPLNINDAYFSSHYWNNPISTILTWFINSARIFDRVLWFDSFPSKWFSIRWIRFFFQHWQPPNFLSISCMNRENRKISAPQLLCTVVDRSIDIVVLIYRYSHEYHKVSTLINT